MRTFFRNFFKESRRIQWTSLGKNNYYFRNTLLVFLVFGIIIILFSWAVLSIIGIGSSSGADTGTPV